MSTCDGQPMAILAEGPEKVAEKGFFDLAYELRKEIYGYLLPRVTPVKNPVRPPAIDSTEIGLRTTPQGGNGIQLRVGDYTQYSSLRVVSRQFGAEVEQFFFEQHKFVRVEKNLCQEGVDCQSADKLDIQMVCFGPPAVRFRNWTLGMWLNLHERPPSTPYSDWHLRTTDDELPGDSTHANKTDAEIVDMMADEDLAHDMINSPSTGSSINSARPESWRSTSPSEISIDQQLPESATLDERPVNEPKTLPPKTVVFEITDLELFCKQWMWMDLAYGALLSTGITLSVRLQTPPALADIYPTPCYLLAEQQRPLILPLGIPKGCQRIYTHKLIDPAVAKELELIWRKPYDTPHQCLINAEALLTEGNHHLVTNPPKPIEALKCFERAFEAMHIVVRGRVRKVWADSWFECHLTGDGPYEGSHGNTVRVIIRIFLVAAIIKTHTLMAMQEQFPPDSPLHVLPTLEKPSDARRFLRFAGPRLAPTDEDRGFEARLEMYHAEHSSSDLLMPTPKAAEHHAEAVYWGMRTIHLLRSRYISSPGDITDRFWWEDLPYPKHTAFKHSDVQPLNAEAGEVSLNGQSSHAFISEIRDHEQREAIDRRDAEEDRAIGFAPEREVIRGTTVNLTHALSAIYKFTGFALQRMGRPEARRILRVAQAYNPQDRRLEAALNHDSRSFPSNLSEI